MKNIKKQYIIGFSVAACALAYLAWTVFSVQYKFMLTPTELLASATKRAGKEIKVTGIVKGVSARPFGKDFEFAVTDSKNSVPIHYDGKVPNNFRDGAEVVVTGFFDSDKGVFEASEMMTKCASKYIAKDF